MKKYFFTGLALILPIALTLVIVFFFFNLLTTPFIGIVKEFITYYGFGTKSFWIISQEQTIHILAKVIIIVSFILLTFVIGVLARWVSAKYLFKLGDKLLHKIPIVNTIYNATKEVVSTLFESKETQFKQVVLVPFPYKTVHSLGLVTREKQSYDGKISVFVPGSPNPSMGFMFLYKPEDLTYLDMSVEEALKMILSIGIVTKELK